MREVLIGQTSFLPRSDRQRSLYRPSVATNSAIKCAELDPGLLRPFCHALRSTVVSQYSIVSFVAALFSLRCPPAVAGLVVAVFVGVSIYAVSAGWPGAHISNEVLERLEPSLADSNPSPAVSSKVLVICVSASRFHSLPSNVFTGVGHAVRGASFKYAADSGAPAGRCISAPQTALFYNRFGTTFALAIPVPSIPSMRSFASDCEQAVFLSRQIEKFSRPGLCHEQMITNSVQKVHGAA